MKTQTLCLNEDAGTSAVLRTPNEHRSKKIDGNISRLVKRISPFFSPILSLQKLQRLKKALIAKNFEIVVLNFHFGLEKAVKVKSPSF